MTSWRENDTQNKETEKMFRFCHFLVINMYLTFSHNKRLKTTANSEKFCFLTSNENSSVANKHC